MSRCCSAMSPFSRATAQPPWRARRPSRPASAPTALLLALATAGCGGAYHGLVPEDSGPEVAALKAAAAAIPARTVRVPVAGPGGRPNLSLPRPDVSDGRRHIAEWV